jgi:hypothetical protein
MSASEVKSPQGTANKSPTTVTASKDSRDQDDDIQMPDAPKADSKNIGNNEDENQELEELEDFGEDDPNVDPFNPDPRAKQLVGETWWVAQKKETMEKFKKSGIRTVFNPKVTYQNAKQMAGWAGFDDVQDFKTAVIKDIESIGPIWRVVTEFKDNFQVEQAGGTKKLTT